MPGPRRGQVGVSIQTSCVSTHLILEPVPKAVGNWLDPPIPFVAVNTEALGSKETVYFVAAAACLPLRYSTNPRFWVSFKHPGSPETPSRRGQVHSGLSPVPPCWPRFPQLLLTQSFRLQPPRVYRVSCTEQRGAIKERMAPEVPPD